MKLDILNNTPPWEWPEDAAKRLLDVLRDERASEADLLLASELAGNLVVINERLVDALLSILRSGARSAEVRSRAAISLGPVLEVADTQQFDDPDDVPISEETFHRIQGSLQEIYKDARIPKETRRRVLEAAVRAPQDWQRDAIREAYASNDRDWRLTAVFCMQYHRGFDTEILEALNSEDEDIHCEAIAAAGNWELDAAWPHVVAIVNSKKTEKGLLLAAIEAVASIRPREAGEVLDRLPDFGDEDIAAAVEEALAMTDTSWDEEDEDLDDDDETSH